MSEKKQPDVEEDDVLTEEDMKELFRIFDTDGGGTISKDEMGTAMRHMGYDPSEEEIDKMIDSVDVDGNGEIDFEEFKQVITGKLSFDRDSEIREVFREGYDGNITEQELSIVMRLLGENITSKEAREMIAEADTDGDGFLQYEEFIEMIGDAPEHY